MTHQSLLAAAADGADAGRQFGQLREALALVREIGGGFAGPLPEALDEAARIAAAYEDALPLIRRRFDTLVSEAAAWVSAGTEALLLAGAPVAAARVLADELERALAELATLLKL